MPDAGTGDIGSPSSSSSAQHLLHVDALDVHRGKAHVLKACTLTVERGTPYAIVGESGSGKTTLLLAALGLLTPTSGTVRIEGRDVPALAPRDRARLAGLVFQDYQLFPHLTVMQNTVLAPRLRDDTEHPDALAERARGLLADLNIGDLADRYPHQLSGGQKQRAAIARSLVLEPSVLFFDEPSAALDRRTTDELAALLARLNATSQVIVVSHDWPFIERCCARGALMAGGRIARTGALDALQDAE